MEGNGKAFTEQPHFHQNTQTPYRAALLGHPANARQALEDAKKDVTKTLLGVAHGIPSVFVTKLLASARPDFIWIDLEHAMFNRLQIWDAV
jgi:4-hydroxy-2-oxoheptanedioate aldolase